MSQPMEQALVRIPIKLTARDVPEFTPQVLELYRWSKINKVNVMLDNNESLQSVYEWIVKNGFTITFAHFTNYAKLRRKAIVSGIDMAKLMKIAGKPFVDQTAPEIRTSRDKLKSEIDALDAVILRGFETLQKNPDTPINPITMMAAIRLKNDLTGGNHGFLTNYGMEQLREIENGKYRVVIEHLISYIPEDKRREAIIGIKTVEDEYYQSTDFYEEYLRASGELSEFEIQDKLKEWKAKRERYTTVI